MKDEFASGALPICTVCTIIITTDLCKPGHVHRCISSQGTSKNRLANTVYLFPRFYVGQRGKVAFSIACVLVRNDHDQTIDQTILGSRSVRHLIDTVEQMVEVELTSGTTRTSLQRRIAIHIPSVGALPFGNSYSIRFSHSKTTCLVYETAAKSLIVDEFACSATPVLLVPKRVYLDKDFELEEIQIYKFENGLLIILLGSS